MAEIVHIIWADGGKVGERVTSAKRFFQLMANRLIVGRLRYGKTNATNLYWTRLQKEVRAYQKTGNSEHLVNIANYCYLETQAPEHPKAHHDSSVSSVARRVGKTEA